MEISSAKIIADSDKLINRNTMTDKISFLNNLNTTLIQTEGEMIERAIACLEIAEKKLRDKDIFTTSYNVEAEVSYCFLNEEDPAHTYWHFFSYRDIIKKEHGLLQDGTDWRETWVPELDKPYCYLLHDLMGHSEPRLWDKIYTLQTIWVDVIYTDQKEVEIGKNGAKIKAVITPLI